MAYQCRACHSQSVTNLIDFGSLPITHRMLKAADEKEDVYPFNLSLCAGCGLIQQREAVPPEILYSGFNFNFSSWKTEPHMADELERIKAYKPQSVLEIGCNDGRFLDPLPGERVGIEPNPVPAKIATERGIKVYQQWVSKSLAEQIVRERGQVDLVVSRQVIEHVHDLDEFFKAINTLLKPDGTLFLDMPDIEPSLGVGDVSTLWEEHVSYFSQTSLTKLLARHGFQPVEWKRYDFSGGALSVIARRGVGRESNPSEIVQKAHEWVGRVHSYRENLIATMKSAGTAVLYGVGCRGVMAVNCLNLGSHFAFAVDDQKERQGLFAPGSRLEVKPSSELPREALVVLAVNAENEERVLAKISRPGLKFASLCSPSPLF
jgi:SAM-dependent methyltransferase